MNNNQENIENLDLNNTYANQSPNNQSINEESMNMDLPQRNETNNVINMESNSQSNMNYNQQVNTSLTNQINQNQLNPNYQTNTNQMDGIQQQSFQNVPNQMGSQQNYQSVSNQANMQQNAQNANYQSNNNQNMNQFPQNQSNNFNTQNFSQPIPSNQTNNSNNTFLIIVIALLSVICILGAVYIITSSKKNSGNNVVNNSNGTTAAPISNSSTTTTAVNNGKTYKLNGFELSFNDNYLIQDRQSQGLYLSRKNAQDFSAVTIDSDYAYDYYVTYKQQLADELKGETKDWSIKNIGEITVGNKKWLELSGTYSGDVMSMYISSIKDASFIAMYRGSVDNSQVYLNDFNTTISNSKIISNFAAGDKEDSFFKNANFDMVLSK